MDSLDKIQLKDDYKYRENPEYSHQNQEYNGKYTDMKPSKTLGLSKNINITLPPMKSKAYKNMNDANQKNYAPLNNNDNPGSLSS